MSTVPQPIARPGATAPHRLNPYLLPLGIFLLLGCAALVGILLAVGNSKPKPPAVPTSAQLQTHSGGLPTVPGGSSSGGSAGVSNQTVAVSPGAGWKVAAKDSFHIVLLDPRKIGILEFESGPLSKPNLVQYAQGLVNGTLNKTTGGKICGKIVAVKVPNGPKGIGIPLCYNIVPQNGQAIPVVTVLLVGLSGRVGVAIHYTSTPNAFKTFAAEAGSVVSTVRWKLLAGT